MARPQAPRKPQQYVEPTPDRPSIAALQDRVRACERLLRAIEDELSDDELSDEQRLAHIAERVAQFMDGR